MKKLILPLSILFLATACTKENMPPLVTAGSARTDVRVIRPACTLRLAGDSTIIVTTRPDERGPVPNEKEPVMKN